MLRHTERMHKGVDLSGIKKEMSVDDDGQTYETSSPEGVKDLSFKRPKSEPDPSPGQENTPK